MQVALEHCGEFLSHIGALEEANAITEILRKTGVELPEASPYRLRALLAAIRRELDAEQIDVVFFFERLLQLNTIQPSRSSNALFGSPLFFHLLVERIAIAYEGLDEEIFKLESDELCHAEGIYETCLLVRDRMKKDKTEMELTKFLTAFEQIFKQENPKNCWDDFYALYHLNDAVFRRDMKRALWVIESVTLGPTRLELALPIEDAEGPAKVVPRAFLEKKFGETQQKWRDLSQIYSISDAHHPTNRNRRPQGHNQDLEQERQQGLIQKQEQEQDQQEFDSTVNEEATESAQTDISEEDIEERRALSRRNRAAKVSNTTRQVSHRTKSRRNIQREDENVAHSAGGQRKRARRGRWSAEEEAALIEGYQLYHSYANVWVLIKSKFPDVLRLRSNVDLKDKYRNMTKYGKLPPVDGSNTGITDNDVAEDDSGADGQASDK